jgi:1-propanol dehydrogenase
VVQQVFRYLPTCWRSGDNLQAREKMHNASCMAGMRGPGCGLSPATRW